jgi:hypothetical protein
MLEELVLLAFCFLAALTGLAVAAWEAISGRVFSIDGLSVTLISLTLAAVFGGNLAWSFCTGEAHQTLRNLRKGHEPKDASEKKRPTPA